MKKYIDKLLGAIIIVIVLGSSIGYAALNKELNISGEVAYRVKADIRITNLLLSSVSDATELFSAQFSKNQNIIGVDLSERDSSITYLVEVTNFSDIKAGIFSIDGLPENLTYELGDYQLKDGLCSKDGNCLSGAVKTFTLTIKYKDEASYDDDNTEYNFKLKYNFKPFHKITYEGFLIDTDSYQKEIIESDTLEIRFPDEIDSFYLTVLINGVNTVFQYEDNVLKVTEVLGDVKIKFGILSDKVLELATSNKCDYKGAVNDITSTDSYCGGSGGHYDEPPYHTYLSGTNACLDFNYVWYSGYMWRITEILNNRSVKMIAENVLSAINFGQDGFFDNSYIKQWLNEDFLDTLYNHDKILVEDATWDISPFYDWCYIKPPNTTKTTVGLLNPYEFSKTGNYGSDSFLNLGHDWWFSSYINLEAPYTAVSGMSLLGGFAGWEVPSTAFGVRPMVVLKADVKFSGTGTEDDPFVLLDDIPNAKPGEKINKRTPGELVKINDMLYRIVNIHKQDGKLVTKLKSANYVKEDNGDVMLKQFGDMHMSTYGKIVDSKKEEYWGAYLNNTWLQQQGIEKYLVKDTYYLDPAQDSKEQGSIIGSYKNTTCADKNTKETIKECKKTANTWTGYVGLPIVGELFSYPLGGNDVHNYTTATMTPYGDDGYLMIGAFEPERQGIFQHTHDEYFAVKPTITLSEDVIIESGDGKTPATAFKIKLPNE